MRVWKQLLISLGVISAGVLLWGRFVPGANDMLEAAGLPSTLVAAIAPAGEGGADGGREGGRGGGFGGGPALVATKPVAMAVVNDRLNAIGDGEAIRSVTVTPYATGNLTEVLVESGDRVEQGQVIARLDSDEQRIAADQARVARDSAAQKLARLQALRSSTSIAELQDAETALKAAELALRNAELALRRRDITAPYGGVVGIISVNPGDYVTTSSAIARIDDRSEILVDFWVPERFATSVRVGGDVTATAVARPGETFTGKVQAIDNRIDQESRTLRVRARIANPEDLLRAGMSFQVTMRFAGDFYPSVDPLSVQWSADGSYIWRVKGETVERVPIHIVQRNPDKVLVRAELAEGDQVVTEGLQTLRPGGAVRTVAQQEQQTPTVTEGS
ncbi:efflux RND transporter periplasmic adaptor subunit [Shinella sp. BYT-45]|uniref:efflux RND transporter periplasmic adaptor subunit n=1 Tax=Shinella sp. BYT-45 TaxID=3377377 RepID=UPI00397F40FE